MLKKISLCALMISSWTYCSQQPSARSLDQRALHWQQKINEERAQLNATDPTLPCSTFSIEAWLNSQYTLKKSMPLILAKMDEQTELLKQIAANQSALLKLLTANQANQNADATPAASTMHNMPPPTAKK